MDLDDIFNDPKYSDLLKSDEKPKAESNTELDRLIEIYNVIKDFYEEHDRLPEKSKDFTERQVFSKYNGLINNPESVKALKEYDSLNILKSKEYSSLDEALDDPALAGLLDSGPLDLFTLKHVKKYEPPEYVARRKKCENFEDYEHLFHKCHADLESGRRQVMPFKGTKIEHGKFYVLKGMLCYVADIGTLERDYKGNVDGRILAIFENGTESDLLLQSLRKSITDDKGLMVTVPEDEVLDPTVVEDQVTGSIYVLRSLIDHEEINSLKHFYKIGFTTESVQDRIRNAEKESTYMYAPVKLIAEYEISNARAQGVEKLIHKFFATANLDIEVNGHNPREWFQVPLPVIDRAINMIISGQIIYYQYNPDNQDIELK